VGGFFLFTFIFMAWLKNKYNILFFVFFVSIVFIFTNAYKWGNTSQTFIASDGFGYYAYLPAVFIYHDKNYEFKWFDDAYKKYYSYEVSGEKNSHFFVPYKNRKINKYYQGLSFLWLPFFLTGHYAAYFFNFPQDGFSYPYQVSIAFAAMCYLLLGLFYLRKMLKKMFLSDWIALIVPIALFYGTYLLWYTVYMPSYTHVYSFTFITLSIYYAYSFFNESERRWTHFLLTLFCFLTVCCLRPLNGLIAMTLFAFIPKEFFKTTITFDKFKAKHVILLCLCIAILANQLGILFIQTGTFFPYTYTNERFYFTNPKLFYVLFSFHTGLFVYVPLAFMAFFGIFCLQSTKQKVLLPLTFFAVVYLYSTWWYWCITTRALIDFYAIIAILLAALLKRVERKIIISISLGILLFLCVGYFQLKSMQIDRGILGKGNTHSDLFWKNFFRIKHARIYAIPPSSIIKQIYYEEGFENNFAKEKQSSDKKYEGNYASMLNNKTDFSPVFEYKLPLFFAEKGLKKIRFSFWSYFAQDITEAQVVINVYNKQDSLIKYIPYYLNPDDIQKNKWDLKEFGDEFSDEELANKKMHHVKIYLWNNQIKNEMYIDKVKTEFILTDKRFEVVQ
jgi:hypothetical protein